jgi:hypothetical protein
MMAVPEPRLSSLDEGVAQEKCKENEKLRLPNIKSTPRGPSTAGH